MQELDDNALLRAYVRSSSEAAFAALVARHVNKVYSVALRHASNPHQAEEITQAVFVILARKSSRLGKNVILEGWLYQTARLTALTLIRAEIRRARREQDAHMQTELNENESEIWAQIAPLLDTAMAGLNETERRAVLLRFFYGKSMKEVGSALGRSEGAVKVRLHRAVEKLRRFFLSRGIASTSETIASAITTHSEQVPPVALVKSISAIAAARGAAATASTLTLVKGAMKIMAWTKAKTAVVAGAAILLAAGATVELFEAGNWMWFHGGPDIQGAWEGGMLLDDAGVGPGEAARTHVVLKLIKTNVGYTATTDWIEMGRKDVPMGTVDYNHPSLRIKRSPRDTWNLIVNADATQMVLEHAIHFVQSDPVLLMRTPAPHPVPERIPESDLTPLPGSDLQGYWKGAIGTGSEALPVNFRIAEQPDGTLRAEGDSPMQGADGWEATGTYTRPLMKLTVASGAGMFQGAVNSADTEIAGSWTQGGQSVPASLRRADYRAEQAQDAGKNYSFHNANDLQGHWKGSWIVTLANVKATVRLALDIAKLSNDSYSATLSNIDDFGRDGPTPTSDFQYDPPSLHMTWKSLGGAYDGKLKDGKLVGAWLQGGGGFPLVFERSESQ